MNRFRLLIVAGALRLWRLPAIRFIPIAAFGLASCSQASFNQGLANMQAATQSAVALNNALVSINNTLIDNLTAQAKLLAPYQCGAVALGTAILEDSSAASKVNAYLAKNVAANVTSVAVKDICATLGYSTTVTKATS